jgi:hypothetical protein
MEERAQQDEKERNKFSFLLMKKVSPLLPPSFCKIGFIRKSFPERCMKSRKEFNNTTIKTGR